MKQYPDWKWIMTEKGSKLLIQTIGSELRCNPDALDMYIYNDWQAYGQIEILENLLQVYHEASVSRKMNKMDKLHQMWAAIEALAFWSSREGDAEVWQMADDGARVEALIELWGATILSMIKELETAGMFRVGGDAPIKNLEIVMAGLANFGYTAEDAEWIDPFKAAVKKYANIKLPRPRSMYEEDDDDENAENEEESSGADDDDGDGAPLYDDEFDKKDLDKKAFWQEWSHDKKFKQYVQSFSTRKGKIGGNQYDIFEMSAPERIKYHFDKVDPLDDPRIQTFKIPEGEEVCIRSG